MLDFFLGSGTTVSVAHKLKRKYVGIEQLNYEENDSIVRLMNVVNGESSGISKTIDWPGGGSFVSCELLENGEELLRKIEEGTDKNINLIKEEVYGEQRIIPYITKNELEKVDSEFNSLNLADKKKALYALVDKNKLYVNFSDINDEQYNINEADKKFTQSFYESEE